MNKDIKKGSIVYSLKGRDAGHAFVVYDIIDNEYVLIVDGKYHTLEKPKKKKIKHLNFKGEELPQIAEKLNLGKQLHNVEINKALRVAFSQEEV